MQMKIMRMKRKMGETVKSGEWRVEEYQDNNTIVGYIAINFLAIVDEMWFLTACPLVCIPMIFKEFPLQEA